MLGVIRCGEIAHDVLDGVSERFAAASGCEHCPVATHDRPIGASSAQPGAKLVFASPPAAARSTVGSGGAFAGPAPSTEMRWSVAFSSRSTVASWGADPSSTRGSSAPASRCGRRVAVIAVASAGERELRILRSIGGIRAANGIAATRTSRAAVPVPVMTLPIMMALRMRAVACGRHPAS